MISDSVKPGDPEPGDPENEWLRVGARLREARQRIGLSARELARQVGVTPQHVSQVERGIGSFSAGVLYAAANRLGVSMDSLFEAADEAAHGPGPRAAALLEEGGIVLRRDQRASLRLRGGPVWERLTSAPEDGIEFLETVYAPEAGGESGADSGLTRHEGREYGVVLSGALRVDVGFESTVLGPGDSIAFDSMVPHRFRNAADTETRAIWFVREGSPGEGSEPHVGRTAEPVRIDAALRRRYRQHSE